MTERGRFPEGLLDTCVLIDIDTVDDTRLPIQPKISTITVAELGLGVALAGSPEILTLRTEQMLEIEHVFDALPFTDTAARRFMTMANLIAVGGRNPKPRKMDLMIAAIASVNDLPLFTRNADDFRGLDQLLTVVPV
ncbi:type II toxin-antitoxin system VapC family toxin [Nocardia arthritidis]|uniref:Type II toxin-antitoxin system VapC family toxin n=1 Tax=Nocardia arthritidis TaxID=228602 RepID=A0A6G9Y6W0_9NOCA|nr:type II toxin-antitoxin system VapC family toxin [Nocardia arthritidis]QIS08939.1 type II toxin-antitoxin system VapC family toxin [Nocardia arthritidis]